MMIRAVQPADIAVWQRMRQSLWPSSPGEHEREIARFLATSRGAANGEVLLAFGEEGEAIGFAEISIRSYAEGCVTDRVLYLEGWYVEPSHRRKGVGAALVAAVEAWGREQGCTEFASDTEIDNAVSARAHASLGFEEVERQICFRKLL